MDPRASLEPTRAGLALARRLGQRSIANILVGNAAEAAVRVGDWNWAERELRQALEEEPDQPTAVLLLSVLAVIDDSRADPASFARLDHLVTDELDSQALANADAARGWHATCEGRLAAGAAAFRQSAAESATSAPVVLALAARAALWNLDSAAAAQALERIEEIGLHGRAIENSRTTIRAGLAALAGRQSDALALYRDALGTWRSLGLRWDEALTAIDMAIVLPPATPEVIDAAEAARQILTELGATVLLDRLEAAMARDASSGAGRPQDRQPAGGAVGSQAG